jgi:hypothetical protein
MMPSQDEIIHVDRDSLSNEETCIGLLSLDRGPRRTADVEEFKLPS